jgi:hypothetical protein
MALMTLFVCLQYVGEPLNDTDKKYLEAMFKVGASQHAYMGPFAWGQAVCLPVTVHSNGRAHAAGLHCL